MMNAQEAISALVKMVRDHYVGQYEGFIDQQHRECPRGAAEVKLNLPSEGSAFRRLYIIDFLCHDENGATARDLQPGYQLQFTPLRVEYRGMRVAINSMRWDRTLIEFDPTRIGMQALNDWFDYWFDPEDARYQAGARLNNVIHSLSIQGEGLGIDFGTAEPAAFMSLMDLLVVAGISEVTIRME
jgi:hypothetical protein